MSKYIFRCLSLLLLYIGSTEAKQQAMTALDLLNLASYSSPRITSDGQRAAYIRKHADWQANKMVADIWLTDLSSGKTQPLTADIHHEKLLSWSPDDQFISYVVKKSDDKYAQIYLHPSDNSEPYAITDHGASIKKYLWANNGKYIYYLANEPLPLALQQRIIDRDDMLPFERVPRYRHLYRVDTQSLKVTKMTEGRFYINDFDLADNGKRIVFTKAPRDTLDANYEGDIWLLNTLNGKTKRITDNQHAEWSIKISADGKQVLYLADINENAEFYYDANLFVVDIKSKRTKAIGIDYDFEVKDAFWSDTQSHIFVHANMGVHSQLWRLSTDGKTDLQLTSGEHALKHWHYQRNNKLHSYTQVSAYNPGDLWWQKTTDKQAHPITTSAKASVQGYALPVQKKLRWQTTDGTWLEGLLSLPLNYKKGKRYPLITQVHGGPKSSDQFGQFRWRTYIPLVAAKGYAYLSVNHRGGRGYGDAFMRDMVGGYFNNAHLDVLSGIDYLIDQKIADADTLIISGWSAGGHMTNKLITFTDRFAAASSGAGAVDWLSMYAESDVRHGRTPWFGGTPWQKNAPLKAYREHSVLQDIWKTKTPTIIFAGQHDMRVPTTQSIMLYRALKANKVPTELFIAPREEHTFKELRHRLFKINAELAWFEKYARNKKYTWQTAPE